MSGKLAVAKLELETHMHYHLHVGMPGYLPNVSETYDTLTEAMGAGMDFKKEFRLDGHVVTGSLRKNLRSDVDGDWQYIEIVPCQDDCLEREADDNDS